MDAVLDGWVTLVSAGVVGAYAWSVRNHFVSDGMQTGARVIAAAVSVSTVLFLGLTWFFSQPPAAQIVGLAIQLFSAWMFYLAIVASRQAKLRFVFDAEHPHSLVDQGPYKFVRHPFYVSYAIFWFGWAVATWSVFAIPSVVILIWLYISAARLEERNFEASPLSTDYAAYKARTGFFVPRLG